LTTSGRIWPPAVAAAASVAGSLLMVYLANRQRRGEQQQDHVRQDAVAIQVAETAQLLLEANERVARTASAASGKLDVIHTLVNSNMTSALRAELDATVRELAMMREVVALHQAAGREPSKDTLTAIKTTQHKVDELTANLTDRLEQTEIANAQEAAADSS
jgi:hypothetical protein